MDKMIFLDISASEPFLCMMKYDAVIFDLGGVVLNLDYSATTRAFENLGLKDFSKLYSQLSQTNLFSDFETGKIASQHFINNLLQYLPYGTSPNEVVSAWNKMILDVPSERLDLLLRLKEQLPIFLLSNTNELHVSLVRRHWNETSPLPMEHFFNTIYFSHEMKMRKPDPEIFLTVCRREGLNPINTLFIDDTSVHIEGAKKAGLLAYHLKDPDELFQFFS